MNAPEILKENGKASLGRWFSIITYILVFMYCSAPFIYSIWDKKAPIAPEILIYMFMICMGFVGNSKWADNFKKKFEGENVDSKPN